MSKRTLTIELNEEAAALLEAEAKAAGTSLSAFVANLLHAAPAPKWTDGQLRALGDAADARIAADGFADPERVGEIYRRAGVKWP